MTPQRYDAFNLGLSQFSPGFRGSTHVSHHPDVDMPSHGGYDFNRMLQQHLSDGASMGYRSNLQNIQENEQDENAENPPMPEVSPEHHSVASSTMSNSVLRGASHREGPMHSSHDRSLFHSLYGQTTGNEPVSSDLTSADMCLSTLYLHELFHRQNRRRSGSIRISIAGSSSQQQQQQHLWQLPHRDGSQQSQTQSTQPFPDGRSAAEKTPLLYPKKT